MNDNKPIELVFTFRSSSSDHKTALLRIRSVLEAAGVTFEMTEVDVDQDPLILCETTVPALPCLKRIEPLPERTVLGMFETAEEILVSLGLRELQRKHGRKAEGASTSDVKERDKFFVYAEDDDNILLLVRTALKRLGADDLLVHCSNGEELLQFLEEVCEKGNKPRFVLLDVRMPKVNGLEALQRIKNHPMLSSLPVVLFSSDSSEQEKEIAKNLGVVACRQKPNSFCALCAELQDLLSQFELQSL